MEPRSNTLVIICIVIVIAIMLGGVYWFFIAPFVQTPTGNSAPAEPIPTPVTPIASSTPTARTPAVAPPIIAPAAAYAVTCTVSDSATGTSAVYATSTAIETDSNGAVQKFSNTCADAVHLEKYICYESPAGSGHFAAGRTIITCPNGCVKGACRR